MLARSTLIYGPAILAPRAAAFALVVLLSHALPKAEFGLYALVVLVGEMLDMGASNWIRLSLLRLDVGRPETWRVAVRQCLALLAGALAVLTGLAAAAGGLLAHERFADFGLAVFAYAVSNGALRLGLTVLQLQSFGMAYSAVEVARAGLLLVSAALSVALSKTFEAVVLWNAGVTGVAAAGCLVFGFRTLPEATAQPAKLPARLAYGLPIVALALVSAAVGGSDRLFLKVILGAASVATYAAAYALARAPLDVIANAVNQGGFPEMMRRYETGGPAAAAAFTRDTFELQTLLLGGAGGLLIGLAPSLSATVLPAGYRAAAGQIIPIVTLGAALLSLKTFVFDNVFHALKRNALQTATYLPAGIVTVAACWALIPRLGPPGAAWAFVLGAGAGLATSAAYAFRVLPLRLSGAEAAKALCAAALAGLSAASIAGRAPAWPGIVTLGLGAGGGGLVWLAVVSLLRSRAIAPRAGGARPEPARVGPWTWRLRRLSRMTPPEIVHRLREQARLRIDALRPPTWGRFDTPGRLRGLPGAHPERADDAMLAVAREDARRAMRGGFDYLGVTWPPLGADWPQGAAWTLDPVSGRAWSAKGWRGATDQGLGDVKYVWELNRLPFLGALGLAAAGGDAAAGAYGYRALAGWMAANPPWAGVNWLSGVEASSRVVSLLWLVACHPPPSAQDEARARAFLHAHAERIARYPSLHSSANNHRVAELVGLFLVGLCLPDAPKAARWRARSIAALEVEIGRQFHPDGVGAEQSPSYAAYALEWFTLAGVAAEATGAPVLPAYRIAASKAAEALRWMLDAGGRPPRIGDDDEGRVLTLRQAPESRYAASVVAFARRWLGEPPLDPRLHDADLRDLLGPPPRPAPSIVAPAGGRTFPQGGLSVCRTPTPQGDALLVFDHGPLGHLSIAAHGHADALAVKAHWADEPVFIDAGTYLYHAGGEVRDGLRGTAAHNTLCLEGTDQSRILGPFAWDRHARTRLLQADDAVVEAEHDGYRRRYGVLHRRRVERLEPGRHRIRDTLIGRSVRPSSWTAGFTVAPACRVEVDGRRARIVTPGGRRLTLDVDPGFAGAWRIEAVCISSRFGRLETARRLVLGGASPAGAEPLSVCVELRFGEAP